MTERRAAAYVYYGQTTSLCGECLGLTPAKIVIEGERVFHVKRCPEHGVQRSLISSDASYYMRAKRYLKPSERPLVVQTRTERGCPFDCGLCPDHEQHSCVGIVEINDACNLNCPVCFADSSPARTHHRSIEQIEFMLDALVASEGQPDVVQISGGEPTIHPDIMSILAMAKGKPIRHLMLNTNGVRIATEPAFARELAQLGPGFEVYLQFDALRGDAIRALRGVDLTRSRRRALEHLEAVGVPTTLVSVVKAGVNDDQIWELVDFARDYRCVRGVTFQPIQDAGRNESFDASRHRVTLSDIRTTLVRESDVLSDDDVVPLPCNPEYIAIAYCLRNGRELLPVTSILDTEEFLGLAPAGIAFEREAMLRTKLTNALALAESDAAGGSRLANLLCCLPSFEIPEQVGYEHVFRISIVEFLDRHNFCVGGVKRSCIHIVHTDGRIIPFDTYNLFYRAGLPRHPKLHERRA